MRIRKFINMNILDKDDGYSLLETLAALTIISTAIVLFFLLVSGLFRSSSDHEVRLHLAAREIYLRIYEEPSIQKSDTLWISGNIYKYNFKAGNIQNRCVSGQLLVKDVKRNLNVKMNCILPVRNDEK